MNVLIQQLQGLKEADAVIAKKREGVRLFTHYIIYAGLDKSNQPVFIGNLMGHGVIQVPQWKLIDLLKDYKVVGVRRFSGAHHERQHALHRAWSEIGKNYSLLGNNCERFANYVQFGKRSSPQVTGWVSGVLGLALLLSVIRK